MEDLLLGIDIGTTAAKAALFSPGGQLQAVAEAEYAVRHVRPAWVEQDPDDWWRAVYLAIRQVLASTPHGAARVLGLAVSSQAPTLLAVDSLGRPLRPALIWMDRRAEAEAAQLDARIGAGAIFRITGNRPDAFYVAAKLRWFAAHEPDLLARTHRFVQANGYVSYRLTHTFSLDHVHAALLQLRDHAAGAWSVPLCEACGVEPSQFPEIYQGHEIVGAVTPQAAEATGLRPGTLVMAGTVDGSAAALEAGVVEAGVAADMTGTSTVLLMANETGVTEPALIAMPHAVPGLHLLLGAMVATGASLRWFRDEFGAAEMQAAAETQVDPFDLLAQQAARVSAGSGGVIFLPYMMGERSPLWHTNARGVFFGLSLATPKTALIRAILEGAAFALRHNVEVAQQAGATLGELRAVGGGSRSALWCQIKADVLGLPVALPETSVGAPFGDALLVGMGLGLYTDVRQSVRAMVRERTRYLPDPDNHAYYDRVYAVFRDIYAHLRADFDRAAAINRAS